MIRVALRAGADIEGFRLALRRLMAADVRPEAIAWVSDEQDQLLGDDVPVAAPPLSLPRAVGDLIANVICHRDPERYALLYALAWRICHGERHLLEAAHDPLVHRLMRMRKSIGRDIHKMHAFVRFRQIDDASGPERLAAWFEPEHFILEAVAGFFVRRFEALHWSIVTPVGSLHWDREHLTIGPPGKRSDVPPDDPFETGWLRYYESTFNPARANPDMMRKEMPVRYWRNMPEAAAIPDLLRGAQKRTAEMIEREGAMPRKREPEKAVAAMAAQRWDLIPGAEPLEDFDRRLQDGLSRIVEAHPDQTVVAVVHGGVIGQLLAHAVGIEGFAFVGADNASISELVVHDGRQVLRRFNDTAHLDAPPM